MRKRLVTPLHALVVFLTLFCLTGCGWVAGSSPPAPIVPTPPLPTTSAPQMPEGGTGSTAPEGSESNGIVAQGSGATTPTAVIAEMTFDATGKQAIKGGIQGTITVTLRSIEVRGETLTLRWALRWDDDGSAADAALSQNELEIVVANATITDPVGLVMYRPFCTDGDWHPLGDGYTAVEIAPVTLCQSTALVSLPAAYKDYFVNHHRVEISTIFPAPQGHPETVDVLVASGVPVFPGAWVAYR